VVSWSRSRSRQAKKPCCGSKCRSGSGYESGKNHSGSGQLRIRNEFLKSYSEKLIKFDNFSTKILNLKMKMKTNV
jgi:hypothetical protein